MRCTLLLGMDLLRRQQDWRLGPGAVEASAWLPRYSSAWQEFHVPQVFAGLGVLGECRGCTQVTLFSLASSWQGQNHQWFFASCTVGCSQESS